jgi:tRNA-splicing ligase RtcB
VVGTGGLVRLDRLDEFRWRVPIGAVEGMRAEGLLFSNEALLQAAEGDASLQQLANVATLPGIVGRSLAMPDIHYGYGFPVGGVAAFDLTEGVVSPGGIGYDINCGVRLLRTGRPATEVLPKLDRLMKALFRKVPSGVGSRGPLRISSGEIDEVLREGAGWAVRRGRGWDRDLRFQEEGGCLAGADPSLVGASAHQRGAGQLGTLGSGNHFLEIQKVDRIDDEPAARAMGLKVGDVVVMLHTGSRGLGHQVGSDYIARMDADLRQRGLQLIDRQLSCAPIDSPAGRDYLSAMAAAANFAWANRQLITHAVREAFAEVFGGPIDETGVEVVYDLSHNMAKTEEHEVDGSRRRVLVHRKGATRSFPAGRPEVPAEYRDHGQPVLIPGDMGSASYVLAGAPGSLRESFGSACHGAGRLLSRAACNRRFRYAEVSRQLQEKGIRVEAASREGVTEEAPGAYKDVEQVVRVAAGAGLARPVARLVPLGVVKG